MQKQKRIFCDVDLDKHKYNKSVANGLQGRQWQADTLNMSQYNCYSGVLLYEMDCDINNLPAH